VISRLDDGGSPVTDGRDSQGAIIWKRPRWSAREAERGMFDEGVEAAGAFAPSTRRRGKRSKKKSGLLLIGDICIGSGRFN